MHDDVSLRDAFSIFSRQRRLIIWTALIGTLLISAVPMLLPVKYTAKSQILIEPQSLIAGRNTVVEQPPDEAVVQTQIAALSSVALLTHAIESLRQDPAYQSAVAQERALGDPVREAWHAALALLPQVNLQAPTGKDQLNLRELQRKLHVFQETGSHVISVSISSRSPIVAALIANRITDLYVQSEDQQKRASTERALAWVTERLPEMASQLQQATASMQAYRSDNKLAGDDPGAVTSQQLESLNRELVLAETERSGLAARAQAIRGLQRQNAGLDRLLGYLDSPRIRELSARANTLEQTLAVMHATYVTSSAAPYKPLTELSEVRRQLQQEVGRAVAALEEQEATATVRVQSLKERLAAITREDTKVKLNNLERQAAITRELYDSMLRRREELNEQRASLSPGVRILAAAIPPEHPSSISPFLFVPPAFVLSLLAGVGGALGRERLDRNLRSERDVREVVDIECIGLVPWLPRLRGRRVFRHLISRPFSPYSEAIRSVATTLLPSVQAGSNAIVVASSVPGEGKTFFAVSLAAYLASIGRKTVLLDFDLRSSCVADQLDGDSNRGLSDVLLNECGIDDVVQHVPQLPLDFVAGAWRASVDPLSILTTDRLKRLLAVLRQRYEVIIMDGPPMLAVAEARLLPTIADQTLFVVAWSRTRREIVRNAVKLLRNSASYAGGSATIRAIITKVDLAKHARYRYGDSGECLMEYRRFVSHSKPPARRSIGFAGSKRSGLPNRSARRAG